MSRTYHHGNKAKERKFGDEWRWFAACPKDWNRPFHTVPKRRKEKHLLHRVLKGEAEQVWPLGSRRPHVYYY